MLTKLHVKNFKAHIDTDLDLKPITVFIGPNNSGKSTLFQLLLLFKEKMIYYDEHLYSPSFRSSLNNEVIDEKMVRLIDLGSGRHDVLYDVLKNMYIDVKGYSKIKDSISKRIGLKKGSVEVHFEIDEELRIIKEDYIGILDDEYIFEVNSKDVDFNNRNMKIIIQNSEIELDFFYFPTFLTPATNYLARGPNKDDEKKYRYISTQILNLFDNLLRSFYFIYGIRGFETHMQNLINSLDNDRTEYLELDTRSQILSAMMLANKDVADKISKWFYSLLGFEVYAELVGDKRSILKIRSDKNNLLINEGLGSQQMLHMLIPIALADELDTIMIEEPEIHLHPKTQSALSKLFIKVWKDEKKQIIYSTHSEHMIFPILSSISRGEIKKEDVAILYFNKEEDGAVKVRPLEINEKGMVRGGLPGFFEKDLDELIDFLER